MRVAGILLLFCLAGCAGQAETVYLFPYSHGEKHQCSQGFGGTLSHTGKDHYSLDFDMPEGTDICAARGGKVHSLKEDSDRGGADPALKDYGNEIVIAHGDGTYGLYCHLKKNGVLVEKNGRVEQGQVIGKSGNTGFSTGPHLHFSVFQYRGKERRTIPYQVMDTDEKAFVPAEGLFYYSFHPGKPRFEQILGRNITPDTYSGYRKKVEDDGLCNMRVEQVDNTIVIFFRNGRDVPVSVDVRMDLDNMSSTRPVPFTETAPALTEIFLVILRQELARKAWHYNYRYNYREL